MKVEDWSSSGRKCFLREWVTAWVSPEDNVVLLLSILFSKVGQSLRHALIKGGGGRGGTRGKKYQVIIRRADNQLATVTYILIDIHFRGLKIAANNRSCQQSESRQSVIVCTCANYVDI